MKFIIVLGLAAFVAGCDQASKWVIDSRMDLYESIPVIDSLFHITYVRNSGGAFGIFAGTNAAIRLPFFITVALVAVVALLYFVRQVDRRQTVLLFALGGILGGALGNLIDRMTSGTVVDFLDVHWRGWYWPTFNVADCFISVGVTILLLHSLLVKEHPAAGSPAPPS